jgi:(+)-trans-carveol dehydrogenase
VGDRADVGEEKGIMGTRLEGKVAMITGAARGQGRAHALTFAREGADIVATDICGPMPAVQYDPATPDDLAETTRLVEELDRRCLARQVDARDGEAMAATVDAAIAEFGRIDILHVNHGVSHYAMWDATTDEIWDTSLSVILTGTWRTVRLVIPHMIEQGGGSIIFTTSAAVQSTWYGLSAYTAAKSGVLGLMRTLSAELAPYSIRVNSIAPGTIASPMTKNQRVYDLFVGREDATEEDARPVFESVSLLPNSWLDPVEVSNAALFLASDEARFVTGVDLAVDAGVANQPSGIPPTASAEIGHLRALLAEKE